MSVETSAVEAVAAAAKLGPWGLLGLLIYLIGKWGYQQKWVWGWQLKEMRDDRDYWRAEARSVSHIAQQRSASTEAKP